METLRHYMKLTIGITIIFYVFVILSYQDLFYTKKWFYKTEETKHSTSSYTSCEKHITVPDCCEKIYEQHFAGNDIVEKVDFGNPNTKIAEKAFFDCANLISISLPSNITEIPPFAFAFCSSLSEICIPRIVTKIDKGAFFGCKTLKAIKIFNFSSFQINIESSAFSNCTMLESIVIPCLSTRINIAEDAFIGVKDKSVEITTFSKSKVSEEDLQKILNETDLDKFKWLKH